MAAADCTVAKYLEVLSHELVRYDMRESAREAKRGSLRTSTASDT